MAHRQLSLAAGQRFSAVRLDGSVEALTWEVVEVFINAVDGRAYARLRQLTDASRTKSISADGLADRTQFVRRKP
jgi:hypothetical protein